MNPGEFKERAEKIVVGLPFSEEMLHRLIALIMRFDQERAGRWAIHGEAGMITITPLNGAAGALLGEPEHGKRMERQASDFISNLRIGGIGHRIVEPKTTGR